ncbi:AAA family ATPase [Sedimentisphaera cyanobacteriorum]|nr:AAA family ATPase [Sedimentisphaera cyanobacteriorum]
MIASREKQHRERLAKLETVKKNVLPISAVYGGNASGKTNFFKAFRFLKRFIVEGTRPETSIPVQNFCLDQESAESPSWFNIAVFSEGKVYELEFSVNSEKVLTEKLTQIKPSSEKLLYERINGELKLGSSLSANQHLKFAFEGTRENQLFLTNSVSQRIEIFKPVYDWFKDKLMLIAPDTRFGSFEQMMNEESQIYDSINEIISGLDTGIDHIGGETVAVDNLPLPEGKKDNLLEEIPEGKAAKIIIAGLEDERIIVTKNKGRLSAKKLVTYHKNKNGTEHKFELNQESDGSKRAVELLPAFLDLSSRKSARVYIIDELNRSLHSLLSRNMISFFLSAFGKDSRSQLLFTTHDLTLFDQSIFRRDEMWLTERNKEGVSKLYSISDFEDVRYDKDIRKSYLQGRMGGVPNIGPLVSAR